MKWFASMAMAGTPDLHMVAMLLIGMACAVTGCVGVEASGQRLRMTYYYVALEQDYGSAQRTAEFLDHGGAVLYRGTEKFFRQASIEGTARTNDGRILNIAGSRGGKTRWYWSKDPYGNDVRGRPLVPFRSAAVDPAIIPLGTELYIAETCGMVLPDGSRHNGRWMAADSGPAIKGKRIDLFVGYGERPAKALDRQGIRHMQALSVQPLSQANAGC